MIITWWSPSTIQRCTHWLHFQSCWLSRTCWWDKCDNLLVVLGIFWGVCGSNPLPALLDFYYPQCSEPRLTPGTLRAESQIVLQPATSWGFGPVPSVSRVTSVFLFRTLTHLTAFKSVNTSLWKPLRNEKHISQTATPKAILTPP